MTEGFADTCWDEMEGEEQRNNGETVTNEETSTILPNNSVYCKLFKVENFCRCRIKSNLPKNIYG